MDELFVWIERYEQKGIKHHQPVNQKAYELLKNDKDLFSGLELTRRTARSRQRSRLIRQSRRLKTLRDPSGCELDLDIDFPILECRDALEPDRFPHSPLPERPRSEMA